MFTFRLRADSQEAIVGQQLEHGPDAVGVSADEDLPVGRVEQHEGEHAVQERGHLFDAEALVQVEQHLAVHLGLVLKLKHFPQLWAAGTEFRPGDVR